MERRKLSCGYMNASSPIASPRALPTIPPINFDLRSNMPMPPSPFTPLTGQTNSLYKKDTDLWSDQSNHSLFLKGILSIHLNGKNCFSGSLVDTCTNSEVVLFNKPVKQIHRSFCWQNRLFCRLKKNSNCTDYANSLYFRLSRQDQAPDSMSWHQRTSPTPALIFSQPVASTTSWGLICLDTQGKICLYFFPKKRLLINQPTEPTQPILPPEKASSYQLRWQVISVSEKRRENPSDQCDFTLGANLYDIYWIKIHYKTRIKCVL